MSKNLNISILYDFYGSMLTQKQQKVIESYYNDDLSLSEIAENEGISRQGVRDSIKRAENQLIDMEEHLKLMERFEKLKSDVEKIRNDAKEIKDANSRFTFSREITLMVNDILKTTENMSEL